MILRYRWALQSLLVATAVLTATHCSSLLAVEWDGDTANPGDYNDPINWSSDSLPGSVLDTQPENAVIGDTSFIGQAVANLNADTTVTPIGDLRVGTGLFGDGVLNHTSGALVTADDKWSFLGADGDGEFPSQGTYNLSGDASFAQSIVDFSDANQFHIGIGGGRRAEPNTLPNQGELNVSDTAQFTVNNFFVGSNDDNEGTVNQSGGTVVAQNWLSIGREGGAKGVYNMTGGQLAVTNDGITVGESSGGTGSMSISGSSVVDSGRLRVGRSLAVDGDTGAGGTGDLTISGSAADITVGFFDVGSNDGTLTNGEGTLTFEADGSGFSTLEVLNDVTLNDGSVEGFADLFIDGSIPSGDHELIDVGGLLTGTFRGLAEGASIGTHTLSYTFGDGNDIGLIDPNNSFLDGDFDMDGDVDIVDFGTFGANFGMTGLPLDPPTDGDFEPDGDVDIVDFGTFGANFGMGTSGSAIPEPASALLVLVSGLALGLRRRQ